MFGKSILLTPDYVDINTDITLELSESISAITSGAYIAIDVTKNIQYTKGSDIALFRKRVQELYPPKTIEAELIEKNGNKTPLSYTDQCIMFNEQETLLTLYREGGISTEKEFVKVHLRSGNEIKNILIYWNNNKK